MCRILFWNVNKKELSSTISKIADSTNADIIVLCEPNDQSDLTLQALQQEVSEGFISPYSNSTNRFRCFMRSESLDLTELHKGRRSSYIKLNIGGPGNLILGLIHGPDLRNYDSSTRQSFAEKLGEEVRFVIAEKRNNKMILLGDFNMNPYDRAMNLASGYNAMSTRACIHAKKRTHLEDRYDFYYNPMWGMLGDSSAGPAGTVFDTSNQGQYGWSTFDQVLFHHSTLDYYKQVEIISEAGIINLANSKGHPNSNEYSDHFPILISLHEG